MAFSQLFSQRFGYALHTLCYMAKKTEGSLTTSGELSQWMQTFWPTSSDTYMIQVIQRLVRGGLLHGHRGKSGGYSLTRKPQEITLRDVVCQLEGIQPPRCNLAPAGDCPAQVGCGILHKLRSLEETFLKSLHEVSIAELACGLGVSVQSANSTEGLLPVIP